MAGFQPNGPIAQLDRVPDFESGGRGFESSSVRHHISKKIKIILINGSLKGLVGCSLRLLESRLIIPLLSWMSNEEWIKLLQELSANC